MNMRREACQDDCNNRDLAILNIYMSTSVPGVQDDTKHFGVWMLLSFICFSPVLWQSFVLNFRCFRGFSRIVIIVVCS